MKSRWTSADLEVKRGQSQAPQKAKRTKEQPGKAKIFPVSEYRYIIGIDPGTKTGVAMKAGFTIKAVETMSIIEAIDYVRVMQKASGDHLLVRIEDARLRTFFGKSGSEKWKGAGSIMRDCAIWEDEMNRIGAHFEMVHPKHVKATTAAMFKKMTGWQGRTSIHAREAAWLVL